MRVRAPDISRWRLPFSEATAFPWILALAALVILAGLGLRDPWPADEPRFAQVAREMVESGQWLFPTRGGELYSDKPPLFMWMVAGLYAMGANLRIAFLLPSALGALGVLVLVHDLARRWFSVEVANRAALLLLATLQFVLQSKSAQIEMSVTFFITLGCYGLLRFLVVIPPEQANPTTLSSSSASATHWLGSFHWYLIGWFAMGLGVITKGVGFLPVLLLVPWAILLVAGATRDEAQNHVQAGQGPMIRIVRPGIPMLAGVVCFFGAIALWLVPMAIAVSLADDPALTAYRDDILFRQTGDRYTDSWAHLSPWYYFLVSVIPLFWLPISLLLPALVRPWTNALLCRDPRIVLPLVWICLVVLFFSLSPGKRGVYVLPCLPMLALIAAPYLGVALSKRWVALVLRVLLVALAILFLTVGIAGLSGLEVARVAEARENIRPWTLLMIIGISAGFAAYLCNRHRAGLAWLVFTACLWLLYSTWGYQIANDARTPAKLYRTIEQVLADTGRSNTIELGLVDFREQYLLFSPYPITHFGYNSAREAELAEGWRWLEEAPDRYLLLADSFDLTCFEQDRALAVGSAHSRDWRLYDVNTRSDECPPPSTVVDRFHYEQGGALSIVENR